MPTNYGVQGADLGRFGAAPGLDQPVLGGVDPGELGGTGAGFIPGQEEVRRRREQEAMRARDPQMVQDLMRILAQLQTTSQNTGLSAGMGTAAPFMGTGPDATGDIGGVNRSRAQQFFGGTLNNPANFAAQGPLGSQAFGSQLDSMLGGLGQGPSGIGVGPGMGAGMGAGIGAGFNPGTFA